MNFNKKEDRIKYLEDKFDNLLDVIGENYGTALMEELVLRLNDTIDDFNKEMSSLFKTLKEREQERQKYLNNISKDKKSKKELTKWEKKLKELEKSK
tara:strand:+ start:578 stop:868 length:291 start_codon:yes stop_codon:yes gene_type:complete